MKHANPFKGSKLREIRLKQCYSQAQVGKAIGYQPIPGCLSAFELGRQRPPEHIEQKLCEFFKVENDYFRK